MKRSNLFLGASALVLAVAGAFTTKAAKSNHALTVATIHDGSNCVVHNLRQAVTTVVQVNRTLKTAGFVVLTKTCGKVVYTINSDTFGD